ncbi:hypothetical protein PHMEG_00013183 [Phytophthora megakarya]|uniref:PiggyBac transposable element-derived protein 4 C-terminal zinc-ribbon domain-containing protein n=1 Tax=Phytophthora megakarya TaxID=4795 RepID=A0A225W9H5_9STRA|nr:hypothetical protein PHMEG_00013183 [Phytophthora megakarya]
MIPSNISGNLCCFLPIEGCDDRARKNGSVCCAAVATDDCLEENPDPAEGAKDVKKRHRSCKVCALHKSKPRKFTKYHCPECSDGVKRTDNCFTICRSDRNNGNNIPQLLLQEHKTRDRPPASRPGKTRARRQQAREEGDVNAEDDAAEASEDVNASSSIGGEEMIQHAGGVQRTKKWTTQ